MSEGVDEGAQELTPSTVPDSAPHTPAPGPREPVVYPAGANIARYVIIAMVGRGGMGQVYSAWDPRLDRRVAVKLVSIASTVHVDGDTQRGRLLREAQALARLEHPNVVKVHDVGLHDEQVFIAMEYVHGQSLRRWLQAKPRSLRAVLEVFLAAGRGLAAAHAADLVHRDFKPDNVLIGEHGEVKVVDFGLARDDRHGEGKNPRTRAWAESEPAVARALERAASDPFSRAREDRPGAVEDRGSEGPSDSGLHGVSGGLFGRAQTLTAVGKVLGTPPYMAPEQHARARVDARSDQYAFCLSLWEAVYGKRPFSGSDSKTLAARKRGFELRESSRGLRVPKWLRSAMLRGLNPRARRRYATLDDLLAQFEAELARQRRWLWPLALLGGGLALAVLSWAQLGPGPNEQVCAPPVERLEGVWDPAHRAQIEALFMDSALVYAEDSWARISRTLDDYTRSWLAAEVEVCEATRLRGQHDALWLEQRLMCLDDRRRALAGLSQQLSRGDERAIEGATLAVATLVPIAVCASEEGAMATPLPRDPKLRQAVTVQLERLALARSDVEMGRVDAGLELARGVASTARLVDWAPLEGEALLELAEALLALDSNSEDALMTLHEAASAALRGHYAELAIQIWARLAVAEAERGHGDQAERWLDYAQTLSVGPSFAKNLRLQAELHEARRALAFARRDFFAAEQEARAHVQSLREYYGEDSPRVAAGLNRLGVAVYMQARTDEAVVAYRQALEILEAVHGPDHPSVSSMHNNIGVAAMNSQAWADAELHYRRALEIRERIYPPGHELVLQAKTNLANLALFSGNPKLGVEAAAQVLTHTQLQLQAEVEALRVRGATETEQAQLRVTLVDDLLRSGRLLAGVGRHRAAKKVFERALALLDDTPYVRLPEDFVAPPHGEPWPPHLDGCRGDVLVALADSLRKLGSSEAAAQYRAQAGVLRIEPSHHPRRCTLNLTSWATARARE